MVLFTLAEIIDLIIMALAIGFIFSRLFKKQPADPLLQRSFWDDLKYGIIVAAPAVVLHELAHKFAAMAFGATAILQAPLVFYAIAIILVLINFPIIFFVGGYVQILTPLPAYASAIVSFAGPGINLLIWAGIILALKYNVIKKYQGDWRLAARLNLFLFAFNMIPIPGFDGFHFFRSLFQVIF